MQVGEKIKKLREFRNFTQEYVAGKLEMTQAGYSRIERNEIDIPFSRLEQISKVLNVSLVEIIGFNEKNIFNNQLTNNSNITNGFVIGKDEHIQEIKSIYESRITDLQKEIDRLHHLLEKTLSK